MATTRSLPSPVPAASVPPAPARLRAVDRDDVAAVARLLPPGVALLPAPPDAVPVLPGGPRMVGYLVLVPADRQPPFPQAAPADATDDTDAPIRVDPARRTAEAGGRHLDLTYLEFELLAHLVAHPDRVHTGTGWCPRCGGTAMSATGGPSTSTSPGCAASSAPSSATPSGPCAASATCTCRRRGPERPVRSAVSRSPFLRAARRGRVPRMRLLVLGGTEFAGRAVVEAALGRGWEVTVFHRGRHAAPDGVRQLLGDRTAVDGLAALDEDPGTWDVVVDTWSSAPRAVRDTARLLRDRAGRYVYVSSRSVYEWAPPAGYGEDAPVVEGASPDAGLTDYAGTSGAGSSPPRRPSARTARCWCGRGCCWGRTRTWAGCPGG